MKLSEFENGLKSESKIYILDGAIGSLIQQRGYKVDPNIWTSYLNFKNPKLIQSIHVEYINAGADIITANTFRTNPVALKRSDQYCDVKEAVRKSIELSKEIADQYSVLLAGSNAPAEDCYQSKRTISKNELEYNHKQHIELLFNSGADFILNETQGHMDEIEIICEYCYSNKIPYVVSLYSTAELNLLSGEDIYSTIDEIKEYNPLAILLNCISSETFNNFIKGINLDIPWGFYLNCGSGDPTDNEIHCGIDPSQYRRIVDSYLKFDPKIIGACCGSTPDHIKEIKTLLYEKTNS